MKLIDRIDWMAYRQMLDKAIAEEKYPNSRDCI